MVLEQSTDTQYNWRHMMLVLEANSTDVTFCHCQFESPELSADSRNHEIIADLCLIYAVHMFFLFSKTWLINCSRKVGARRVNTQYLQALDKQQFKN
jgi:hypothetical protein